MGKYSERLSARLRGKIDASGNEIWQRGPAPAKATPAPRDAGVRLPGMSPDGPHPDRYPVHDDPAKGQVHGGVCNVTACNRRRACWFNTGTRGLYCTDCARGIDAGRGLGSGIMMLITDAMPTHAEMDELYKNTYLKACAA